MKRRIYIGMLLVTLINLVLASVFLSAAFYAVIEKQVRTDLKNKAQILAAAEKRENGFTISLNVEAGMRMTLIAPDGGVLFDTAEDASDMENHASRPEIQQARENGYGEATRYSETLRLRYYCYAIRLDDGRILRVSKDTKGIFDIFARVVPHAVLLIFLILAVDLWLAARVTKSILAPIFQIDLNAPDINAYDELTDFVRTILKQRRQIEMQMADLQSRTDTFQSIINHMREGFLMLDKAGSIVTLNKSAEDILHAHGDYAGRAAIELIRDTAFGEKVKQALNGTSSDMLLEKERVHQVFFNNVPSSGGVIVLFVDITDSRKAEQMRRSFTANVSHELKTPLTSISGYAELMLAGLANPSDIGRFAGKIRNEATRMVSLVDDILFLSKLDETEHKTFELCDLTVLAEEAIDAKRLLADEKQVTLPLSGGPCVVHANKQLMYELLINLIDNGIKYNIPNGRVVTKIEPENGGVLISVTDTGIGIPKEHHQRVFERFYRVDPSRSKKTGGTGLGLSIVKHIAQYHGGTTSLESEPDMGTTVKVWINDCQTS